MFKTLISLFWHLCLRLLFVYFLSLQDKDSGWKLPLLKAKGQKLNWKILEDEFYCQLGQPAVDKKKKKVLFTERVNFRFPILWFVFFFSKSLRSKDALVVLNLLLSNHIFLLLARTYLTKVLASCYRFCLRIFSFQAWPQSPCGTFRHFCLSAHRH